MFIHKKSKSSRRVAISAERSVSHVRETKIDVKKESKKAKVAEKKENPVAELIVEPIVEQPVIDQTAKRKKNKVVDEKIVNDAKNEE